MQALEDQCLGSGSDERFIAQAYSSSSANPKLKAAKIMPNSNFIVSHVVGDIQYNVTGFIEKNKDILRGELMEIMNASKDNVVNNLFEGLEIIKGGLPKGQLIGSQYLVQLNSMMKTINATECHFIRCIKTNDRKAPLTMTNSKVLIQLYALSVFEALQLRQIGYAYRRPFDDFLHQFKFINMEAYMGKGDASARCRALLKSAGMAEKEGVAIGKTMVFMKKECAVAITRKSREALAAWDPIVGCIECLYRKNIKRQNILAHIKYIERLQDHARRVIDVRLLKAVPKSVEEGVV